MRSEAFSLFAAHSAAQFTISASFGAGAEASGNGGGGGGAAGGGLSGAGGTGDTGTAHARDDHETPPSEGGGTAW